MSLGAEVLPARSSSVERNLTLGLLVVSAIVLAAMYHVPRAYSKQRATQAAMLRWRAEHDCRSAALGHGIADAWGSRIEIRCVNRRIVMRSAGVDGRFGSPDDIVLE